MRPAQKGAFPKAILVLNGEAEEMFAEDNDTHEVEGFIREALHMDRAMIAVPEERCAVFTPQICA